MKITPNEEMLLEVARKIPGDLLEQVVFLGGAVVGCLLTDDGIEEVRNTKDVDIVVGVASNTEFQRFQGRLRKAGFSPSIEEDAPICRWQIGGVSVDIMPIDEKILGFSNKWYKDAVKNAQTIVFENVKIKIVSAPYFLATKIEAFLGRGKGDFLGSADMEDIITIIDGRKELTDEIERAGPVLRRYCRNIFRKWFQDNDFLRCLSGNLNQDRIEELKTRMLSIGMKSRYPYSIYGFDIEKEKEKTEKISVIRAKKIDIDSLRKAYESILPEVLSTTFCASFARGGLVFLNYAVAAFCKHTWGNKKLSDFQQLEGVQKKFHLLPSVTWKVKAVGGKESNCTKQLKEWLKKYQTAKSVLLVDTSLSGGGINKIKNTIQEIPEGDCIPSEIKVVGILDLKRYQNEKKEIPENETITLPTRGKLSIRWVPVTTLFSEDLKPLLGYELKKLKAGMMAIWPESFLVIEISPKRVVSFATSNAATIFSDLLIDWNSHIHRGSQHFDGSFDEKEFVDEVRKIRGVFFQNFSTNS